MKFPLIESIIWVTVFLLIILIGNLIIYLKVTRRNIRVNDRIKIKYTKKIEELLIQFLYTEGKEGEYNTKQKKILNKFKVGVNSKKNRKIITSTFINLSQEISGNMILSMHKLYEEIGLLKYAIKKLRSKKWNIIAIGIRDLRLFKIERTKHLVEKFVNHPREEVRREAHLYFLELFGYQGMSFLDNLKRPISEWDQIQLIGRIQKIENHDILDLTKWLKSKNDYVVLLILNIVKLFNRLETKDILLKLVNHKNIEVRIKTIEVLTHFDIAEANTVLKSNFDKFSTREKITFFNLLEKTATKEDTFFILDNMNSSIFEIKHKSLKILKTIDLNLYQKLEKKSDNETYNEIINFLDLSHGI